MPTSVDTPLFASRRFELIRVLGAGGMGVVYEVFDRERKSRVALKMLRADRGGQVTRLKHEFRALQDIAHPNLVSLGELLEEDDKVFFTMELVRGVTFLEYVRAGSTGIDASASTLTKLRPGIDDTPPLMPVLMPSSERANMPTRPPPSQRELAVRAFDEARLRAALAQLAIGIEALHLARRVHRDLKPSNVLVTDEGRVVILDFGLIASTDHDDGDESIVGTAHFMAPEQAARRAAGPEADWYSVGVMLYLALAGRYPFEVSNDTVLNTKQFIEPSPPGHFVSSLPPDLESLCVDLLRIEPSARPSGADVLRRLSADEAAAFALPRPASPVFVGRRRELAALRDALDEADHGAVVALVEGEPGMGKSALVRRFLDEISARRSRDVLIFSGRCYARDAVTFKAVDEIVEGIARHLTGLTWIELGEVMPPHTSILASIFPSFAELMPLGAGDGGVGRAGAPYAPKSPPSMLDPQDARAAAFGALRALCKRLSDDRLIVIAIDDLQWADADGLALLSDLVRPEGAPRLLFVATVRSGASAELDVSDRIAEVTFAGARVHRVMIGRLPDDDARALASVLIEEAYGDAIEIEPLLAEARGHPLFIDALVRHRITQGGGDASDRATREGGAATHVDRLDEAIFARFERIRASAQHVLTILAAAGAPVSERVLAAASGFELDELDRACRELSAAELARASGAGSNKVIELYHARIGETVIARISPEAKRAAHAALALALHASGDAELSVLAGHYRDAGDVKSAASYAHLAADQAAAALAFDRAAKLYREAITLDPPPGPVEASALSAKLGDALSNAGFCREAADAYLAAAAGEDKLVAIEHERRAAENLLRSGYIEEGLDLLAKVLAVVGMSMPRSNREVLAKFLIKRAELKVRGISHKFPLFSAVRSAPLTELFTRIDVCWSAALGLGMVDALRGALFQTQNLLLSLEAGEPYRLARALAMEICFLATAGTENGARVAALLPEAEALAARADSAHATGLLELARGLSFFFTGRYREALSTLDRAEAIFRERCTGVSWERATAGAHAVWSLYCLGDLDELSRRIDDHLRLASDRGDRLFGASLRSNIANVRWLMDDDPDRAEREARQALESWPSADFQMQHLFDLLARGGIDLYRGDGERAHERLAERWSALERSNALRVQFARVLMHDLRGRAAIAAASSGRKVRERLDVADREAKALESERVAWAEPLAAILRAGAASVRGHAGRVVESLRRAAITADSAGMALHAAVARAHLAMVDHEAAAKAEAWLGEHGVVEPKKLAAMLCPGVRLV